MRTDIHIYWGHLLLGFVNVATVLMGLSTSTRLSAAAAGAAVILGVYFFLHSIRIERSPKLTEPPFDYDKL